MLNAKNRTVSMKSWLTLAFPVHHSLGDGGSLQPLALACHRPQPSALACRSSLPSAFSLQPLALPCHRPQPSALACRSSLTLAFPVHHSLGDGGSLQPLALLCYRLQPLALLCYWKTRRRCLRIREKMGVGSPKKASKQPCARE